MKPVLKNWYITIICKEGQTMCRAHGIVFGHISPRCIDGQHIHTSSIKEITLSDEDTLQIHTKNTIYYVKLNEYGTLTDINNAADRDSFPTSNDDCTADALKNFNIPTEIYPKMICTPKVRHFWGAYFSSKTVRKTKILARIQNKCCCMKKQRYLYRCFTVLSRRLLRFQAFEMPSAMT